VPKLHLSFNLPFLLLRNFGLATLLGLCNPATDLMRGDVAGNGAVGTW
jgi:hypothetical protein